MHNAERQFEASSGGKWVTEATFASISGLARQSLTNWRARDRKAGRRSAEAGYPHYVYFGSAVRYWASDEMLSPKPAMATCWPPAPAA
jgi:hypothetical protein